MPLGTTSTEFERLKRSGDAHFGRKEYRVACQSYREALQHGRGSRQILFNFAYCLAETDDFEGAVFRYRQALEEGAGPLTHNNLGNALRKLGRIDEAKASFLKATRLDRCEALYWRNLASCHSEVKDSAGELAALESLVGCGNANASDWNSLGRAHAALGAYERALAAFRVAAFLSQSEPTYFFNMAYAMEKCGRVLDAYHACRHSLQLKNGYGSAVQSLPVLEAALKQAANTLNANPKNSDPASSIRISADEIGPQDYVNPYVLLNIPVAWRTEWFQKPADWINMIGSLTRRRRALKAELELNDGHLSWLPGLRITDEIVHRVLSGLDDEGWHPHHWAIFRLPLLNRFLMFGDSGYFHAAEHAPYPLVAEMNGTAPDDPRHGQFKAFLSPFFRHRWTISIKQALQHGNYHAACALFSTHVPVLSGDFDEALDPVRRHFGEKCSALRHLEESLEKGRGANFDEHLAPAHAQARLLNILPEHSGARLSEEMCARYRAINFALANHRKDFPAADRALKAAESFKVSETMQQCLQKDRKTLNGMLARAAPAPLPGDFSKAANPPTASPKKRGSGNAGCLVLLVIAGLFQLFGSLKSKLETTQPSDSKPTESSPPPTVSTSTRLASPSPETYSPVERKPDTPENLIIEPDLPRHYFSDFPAVPLGGGNEQRVFRVPSHLTSELNRDREAIDREKAELVKLDVGLKAWDARVVAGRSKAEKLENRHGSLNTEINEEKYYINKHNAAEVREFNLKVQKCNTTLRDFQAQSINVNQDIKNYNIIVQQIRSRNTLVNSLVGQYNAKLERYGRASGSQ